MRPLLLSDDGDVGFTDRVAVYSNEDGSPYYDFTPMAHWLPDLEDPATIGCLLALVREVWGPRVTTSHRDRAVTSRPWAVDIAPDGIIPMGSTEAEALVAALHLAEDR